ncbi:hypothetical protein B0H19DRAFT_7690 [Mycena capillaripes]|nr:hypothetical protein B0H19DRAFT_7690 [Mycena capillaripes]
MIKALWISLVRDMGSLGLLDLPPDMDFQDQSTNDLIAELKRVVRGPKTWSTTWSSAPALKRQIVLPVDGWHRVRLLPGGRYFALQNAAFFKIFSVVTNRCVWTWTQHNYVQTWSADMRAGGDEAVIGWYESDGDGNRAVQMSHIHLIHGHLLNSFRVTVIPNVFYPSRPSLLGDMMVIGLNIGSTRPLVLMVNWRTEEYILFNRIGSLQAGPVLVPGHLIITSEDPQPTQQQIVRIYSFTPFTPLWRPVLAGLLGPVGIDHFPFMTQPLEFRNIPIQNCGSVELLAYKSPILDETYRVMIHTTDYIPKRQKRLTTFMRRFSFIHPTFSTAGPSGNRSVLFTYSFTIPKAKASPPVWRFVSSAATENLVYPASLTFSRYCLDRRSEIVIDALLERDGVEQGEGQREVVTHSSSWLSIYLSRYSSTVAALTSYSLTISYYL